MSSFTFTGIEVNQRADSSIVLSQSAYVRKIAPIAIDPNRKTQIDLKVTEPERLALRGVIGSLQYAAINTRPDLSSRLSMLQSNINQATIETLQEANKLLHEAKKYHDMTITIKSIPEKDFRFMAFSHASFSSASKPDSHAGLVIVGTHQDILKNHQCPISPISWGMPKDTEGSRQYLSCRDHVIVSGIGSIGLAENLLELDTRPSDSMETP